jgi:hypothetical protein
MKQKDTNVKKGRNEGTNKRMKKKEIRIRKLIAYTNIAKPTTITNFQVPTLHKILPGNSISLPNNTTVLYAILKT